MALGSDFDSIPPKGIRDISHLPLLTDMLRRGQFEGHPEFLGGNFPRISSDYQANNLLAA
ncbi:MAG: hypothetical protein WKF37_23380 [Bryobacteraceae bacterium]